MSNFTDWLFILLKCKRHFLRYELQSCVKSCKESMHKAILRNNLLNTVKWQFFALQCCLLNWSPIIDLLCNNWNMLQYNLQGTHQVLFKQKNISGGQITVNQLLTGQVIHTMGHLGSKLAQRWYLQHSVVFLFEVLF